MRPPRQYQPIWRLQAWGHRHVELVPAVEALVSDFTGVVGCLGGCCRRLDSTWNDFAPVEQARLDGLTRYGRIDVKTTISQNILLVNFSHAIGVRPQRGNNKSHAHTGLSKSTYCYKTVNKQNMPRSGGKNIPNIASCLTGRRGFCILSTKSVPTPKEEPNLPPQKQREKKR